jgi:hypothetical protein
VADGIDGLGCEGLKAVLHPFYLAFLTDFQKTHIFPVDESRIPKKRKILGVRGLAPGQHQCNLQFR